ncbi:hypothetical protein, unknown function [Leishmania donovani]|uniref:Nodulin-like domain-containing protein n=1 Tax=Leishmania donovani TaxID=5661 RepID=E9BFH9_LEIDO|nr:hypothetical protein, unknown function [Leishmania donovani]TPP49408.1 hypothetical protein CGC21_34580 [Leishmania donovani]CBZ34005.1 hypothetical protein, unknown function [Leishmania donovani]
MPSCGASLVSGLKKLGKPIFSQTRELQQRKEKGLHPVSELRRFHLFVCCFFCSVCASLTYAFDLFTTQFRSQFKLTLSDLTIISTVGLVFCYFTIPYTFIFQPFGPFSIFWICATATAIGGIGLAGVFRGQITGNTATITVFYAFLNTASGLIDMCYVSTLVEVFPRNRGPIVCLAKVMTGLGSSVFAAMSSTFFEDNIDGFIYFITAFVIVVCIWSSFVIVLPPYIVNWWRRQGKTPEQIAVLKATVTYYERKFVPMPRLIVGYAVVLLLLVFFTTEAPVLAYVPNVSRSGRIVVGIMTVALTCSIVVMLLPLRILGGMNELDPGLGRLEDSEEAARTKDVDEDGRLVQLDDLGQEVRTSNEGSGEVLEPFRNATVGTATSSQSEDVINKYAHQDPRYEGTVKDYLLNIDVWLIMLLFICYGCMGVIVLYNSSTISIALTGHKRSTQLSALYTAFLGVGSSVGRIAFGLFEAYVQHQDPENRKVLVSMALPVSPAMAFLAGIFLLFLPGKAVLLPFILVYMEEGIFAGINALIFPCMFESNHNFLYNLSFFVQMCSIISFNLGMFGRTIDREQRRLHIPMDRECNVKSCVRTPIIVSTVLAFFGVLVALAIHFRYAAFVRGTRERMRPPGAEGSEPTAGTAPIEEAKPCATEDANAKGLVLEE